MAFCSLKTTSQKTQLVFQAHQTRCDIDRFPPDQGIPSSRNIKTGLHSTFNSSVSKNNLRCVTQIRKTEVLKQKKHLRSSLPLVLLPPHALTKLNNFCLKQKWKPFWADLTYRLFCHLSSGSQFTFDVHHSTFERLCADHAGKITHGTQKELNGQYTLSY